jgi:hypothetical protein
VRNFFYSPIQKKKFLPVFQGIAYPIKEIGGRCSAFLLPNEDRPIIDSEFIYPGIE